MTHQPSLEVLTITPEVGAALIGVVGVAATVAVGFWQTRKTLTAQADIAADGARDQARLAAGTTLLPLRKAAYGELWTVLDVGPAEAPKGLACKADRGALADKLTAWYYPNGLLLSDGAQKQWRACRDELRKGEELQPEEQRRLHQQLSLLRSWLKADLLLRSIDKVSAAAHDINAGHPGESPAG